MTSDMTVTQQSSQQPILNCPICSQLLLQQNNSLICSNNHCFDFAKEGYVNLLAIQQKKTKNPGDNKEMIRSRKHFLEKGYYDFLLEPLASLVDKHAIRNQSQSFLDCGCGEGYFTDQLNSLTKTELIFYGMDISKDAIRSAAKRTRNINWFVASSNNIPVVDNSIDVALKINAPLNHENLLPKLTDQAIVISVTPGTNHLASLRKHLYLKPQQHQPEETPKGFQLIHQSTIESNIAINYSEDIQNLFIMTPYYWNSSNKVRKAITELEKLDTMASFSVHIYQQH